MSANAKFGLLYFPGALIVSPWQRRLAASSLYLPLGHQAHRHGKCWNTVLHKTGTNFTLQFTVQLYFAVPLFREEHLCTK